MARRTYSQRRKLNLTAFYGNLSFEVDSGFPVQAVIAAWLFANIVLAVFILTVSLGAIFGLFGLVGPTWLESVAIFATVMILGYAWRND